jgi:BarA-like signal transduction histidine kinase
MRINLRVEFSDKPGEHKEIVCLASDMVKFETHFNISIANLDKDLKITHLLFLAWASETRTKATAKTFDEWIDGVVSIAASDDPKA